MRAADRAAIRSGTPSIELMEAAASALVSETLAAYSAWRSVVVVCGPGNNGGDGLPAARLFRGEGLDVRLFCLGRPEDYRGDPAENLARALELGLEAESLAERGGEARLASAVAACDGVVDALFGTGLSRPLTGGARRAVVAIGRANKPVVAADVPSGLSSDSAAIPGPSVRADLTVVFAAPKVCHVVTPARTLCGRVVVRDIGIDVRPAKGRAARFAMTEPSDVRRLLPPRPSDSNKGDFGRLAIVAGSTGKSGAAVLAARGAIRGGAGLVTVFCPGSVQPVAAAVLPEAMSHALPDRGGALSGEAAGELVRALNAGPFDAAVVGPGLSTAPGVVESLKSLLATRLPLVLDADALNGFPKNAAAFRRRAPTVLTPHPGEAGRLLGSSAAAVQKDRLGAARALAKASRAVVLLKGDGTLVADPSGRVVVNPTGSPLLATGGTGDVLAGLLGALLAQGLDAFEAAYAAAWLHGRAAEILAETLGDAGLLARELADAIPRARAGLSTLHGGDDGDRTSRIWP